MISVIVPSYNEEDNVKVCAEALKEVLCGEDFEIIFVDDGSSDKTWERISEASGENVRGLRLSRNFGKEAAIRAGLEEARGEAAAVIDCDLQHPPETLKEMIKKWREGSDVVEGKKLYRGRETKAHGLFAEIFNKMMSKATGFDMSGASDFILLGRPALDAILQYNESGSFFRALAQYVGFKKETVYYKVAPRERGKGKFTFKKLFGYALRNLAAFSSLPLYLGIFFGAASILAAFALLVLKLCRLDLGSFTGGVICLIFLGGLILMTLGAAGFYLARIYEEVKRRPKYIISSYTDERKSR